jgi:hypothetical protein
MLPGVNAQQGRELAHDRILVGVGADEDLAGLVVLDKPGPAGALDAG